MIENEYSFLVEKLPDDIEKYPKKEIAQGYFSKTSSALRIRKENNKYILNQKVQVNPDDFSRFHETEIQIKKEEFELLYPKIIKGLTKTRYYYPLENDLKAEIDEYHGKLEGLMTVEVEFPDEKARTNFKIPDWFGKDVTQESWAANSELSNLTFEEVLKLIK